MKSACMYAPLSILYSKGNTWTLHCRRHTMSILTHPTTHPLTFTMSFAHGKDEIQ